MKLRDVVAILEGDCFCCEPHLLEAEVTRARASDLMSEILAADALPDILLTGLCNTHVIRTASVFGIKAVIIVRGKAPTKGMIDMANEEEIVLASTKEGLFTSCGKLYAAGIRGVKENI